MEWWTGILTLALCAALTSSYPKGPPVQVPGVCTNMMPQHNNHSAQPKHESPYEILFNTEGCFHSGQKITFLVKVKDGLVEGTKNWDCTIEGLFLQVRKTGTEKAIGTWTSDDSILTPLTCHEESNSAIGHNVEKKSLRREMYWTAPANEQQTVKAWLTVVCHLDTFWVMLDSEPLQYDANCPRKDLPSSATSLPGSVLTFLLTTLLTFFLI